MRVTLIGTTIAALTACSGGSGGGSGNSPASGPTLKTLQDVLVLGKIPGTEDLASQYDEVAQAVLKPYTADATVSAVFVSPSGAGSKDGSSWENAWPGNPVAGESNSGLKTKLTAINDAGADKIYLVLLAGGAYNQGDEMSMKDGVAIVGGWASRGGWTRGTADTTILNGSGLTSSPFYRVFTNNGLDHTALLYGVTLSNGIASITAINDANQGGGMFNDNASPTLTNVMFLKNAAYENGGGIYNRNSSPILTNVTFTQNESVGGTASAMSGGGGMYNLNSSPVLLNVLFSGNKALNDGSGMFNNDSSPTLTNVTFSQNISTNGGNQLNNAGNSNPVKTNVVEE